MMIKNDSFLTNYIHVADDDPKCGVWSTTSSHNPEQIHANCTIKYNGDWIPSIAWKLRYSRGGTTRYFPEDKSDSTVLDHHYVSSRINVTSDSSTQGSQLVFQIKTGYQSTVYAKVDQILERNCHSFLDGVVLNSEFITSHFFHSTRQEWPIWPSIQYVNPTRIAQLCKHILLKKRQKISVSSWPTKII